MDDTALIKLIIQVLRTGLTDSDYEDASILQAYQPTQQGANTARTYYLAKIPGDKRLGFPMKSDAWSNVVQAEFTGFISGHTLNVTAVTSGTISIGYALSAIGLPPNVLINAYGTGSGGVGSYTISISTTIVSQAMTAGTPAMVHREVSQYETTFNLAALSTQNPKDTDPKTASDMLNYAAYILQSQMSIATFEAQGVGVLAIKDVPNTPFTDDRDQFEYGPNFNFVMTHKRTILSITPALQSEEIQILRV